MSFTEPSATRKLARWAGVRWKLFQIKRSIELFAADAAVGFRTGSGSDRRNCDLAQMVTLLSRTSCGRSNLTTKTTKIINKSDLVRHGWSLVSGTTHHYNDSSPSLCSKVAFLDCFSGITIKLEIISSLIPTANFSATARKNSQPISIKSQYSAIFRKVHSLHNGNVRIGAPGR